MLTLSPTPPVLCLSTMMDAHSWGQDRVSPVTVMALVRAKVSSVLSPLMQVAIKKAPNWDWATPLLSSSSIKKRISSTLSSWPNFFFSIKSGTRYVVFGCGCWERIFHVFVEHGSHGKNVNWANQYTCVVRPGTMWFLSRHRSVLCTAEGQEEKRKKSALLGLES